jgi:hypothetical protein
MIGEETAMYSALNVFVSVKHRLNAHQHQKDRPPLRTYLQFTGH